jgi:hypothetical protein
MQLFLQKEIAMKIFILFISITLSSMAVAIVPNEAFTFDFNIKTVNMNRSKEEKLFRSVELLRGIFSSEEFRQKILEHRFKGKRSFHYSQGLSNLEVYTKILEGIERLYPLNKNSMDVEIELYSNYESNVLGFTRPFSKRIWMNTKYFNKHEDAEVASHLTHEWLHKLGFDHEKQRTEYRRYSIPYAVGYIVKDLARTLK